jgi:hypothetical protein
MVLKLKRFIRNPKMHHTIFLLGTGTVLAGIWRIRSNKELADLYQEIDLATVIKTLQLRWLGHVCRMGEQRYPKKPLDGKPGKRRKRGKPRTRWIDNVEDDLKKMRIKRWRLRTADRREWRGICEAARILQEL